MWSFPTNMRTGRSRESSKAEIAAVRATGLNPGGQLDSSGQEAGSLPGLRSFQIPPPQSARWYVRLFPSLTDLVFLFPLYFLFSKIGGIR